MRNVEINYKIFSKIFNQMWVLVNSQQLNANNIDVFFQEVKNTLRSDNLIHYNNRFLKDVDHLSERSKELDNHLLYFVYFLSYYFLSGFFTFQLQLNLELKTGERLENFQIIFDKEKKPPRKILIKIENLQFYIYKEKISLIDSSFFDYKGIEFTGSKGVNEVKLLKNEKNNKEIIHKPLNKEQESLIECITGEIYRYLIGNSQPKTKRTPNNGVIFSKVENYLSLRKCIENYNLIEQDKKENYLLGIKEKFRNDLKGFVSILISAIFLEENDLSDANYGFGPDDKLVKIDHGQSLNTLRISEEKSNTYNPKKKIIQFAEKKYYPNSNLSCKRESLIADKLIPIHLKYDIDTSFINSLFNNFFSNNALFLKSNIKMSQQRPAASPLYDSRLKNFIDIKDIDLLDKYKWQIIYKIINTNITFYEKIIYFSSSTGDILIKNKVFDKIKERINLLSQVANESESYKCFIDNFQNINDCNDDIEDSQKRMLKTLKYN